MSKVDAASSLGRQTRLELALSKRMRELACLYNLLTVFEAPDLSLDEVYASIPDNLIRGWQYPEKACARLSMGDSHWQTDNYRATPWLLSQPIVLHGQVAGSLEVGYLEAMAESDNGPFLIEELVLLEVVAGRLSRFVERRQYGQEVKNQRDFARGLVETAQAIVLVLDDAGRVVYFNPFLEKLSGYRLAEVRGHDWRDVFLPTRLTDEQESYFRLDAELGARQSIMVPIRASDGSLCQVEWRNRALPPKDGQNGAEMLCTGQDMTRRLELENEYYRLAAVVEQSVDAVAITDTHRVMLYVNPAFEKLYGRNRDELLGQDSSELFTTDEGRVTFGQIMADLNNGHAWSGKHVVGDGAGHECEVETVVSPIRDQDGNIINYYAHHRDITHEQRMRDHLRQAQKMEAIGTLAGGIAHDFNNILGAISGYIELSRMFLSDATRAGNYLEQALKAGERAKELVGQILTFSRQSGQQNKPLDLASEVREALRLVRATLPTTIEIVQEFKAPQTTVMADSTQIQQVVLNLCTNAAHAMRQRGGRLVVGLELLALDDREAETYPGLRPGPHLRLSISDTGHGMSREVLERIFEPFFTTKAQGEGTGLGLAVVHGIISSYHGIIRAYSQPGKGTVFYILLPCLECDSPGQESVDQDVPTGHERIMVVDDEVTLVEIQRSVLGSLGYEVSAFTSSPAALAHLAEHGADIDLLLTDLTMPGLTGLELAQSARGIKPGLPVIMCTGFGESQTLEQASAVGVREVLLKPLLRGDLARAVRRVLDSPAR